ncbi:MAG: cardiolipin synthase [Clostridia bacterium]|nr:cardiolipin synthase [Clostridia bacterium]
MKITYKYKINGKEKERMYTYIPLRYILAFLITLVEVSAIIGIVIVMCLYVPYFYILAYLTEMGCVLKIISSDNNPDYKVPWLLVVLILPVIGFMLYFIFSSRTLKKKYVKKIQSLDKFGFDKDDTLLFNKINSEDDNAYRQAKMATNISGCHLYNNTSVKYFPSGEEYFESLLVDLKNAEKFIFVDYFIIEEGKFFDSVLEVLKEKAKLGVEVKMVYDDIGCMKTLPANFQKHMNVYGIQAVPFSRLKGGADSEFNNRNHRKITVIDGKIGYTGGINLADEYINHVKRFGHWKDSGVRLEGQAVWELTKLFVFDFGINVKQNLEFKNCLYPEISKTENGYVIPFGDGPNPIYDRNVGKCVIQNMLANASKYAYFTTPYLIMDNDLCNSIESASLRGVDVRIIVPHIPDKKIVFGITKSFYSRLLKAGVKIYQYTPGFIHAKNYLVDDVYGLVGTINLDYRSLVHHFENGVWMYKTTCLKDLKSDILKTLEVSQEITADTNKPNLLVRFFRSIVRIFAPLL